jgi:hypothetical protein
MEPGILPGETKPEISSNYFLTAGRTPGEDALRLLLVATGDEVAEAGNLS